MIVSSKIAALLAGSVSYALATAALEGLRPILDLMDADALLVMFHGALGGSARWLFLREPWRDGLRLMVLGAVLAAGVGNLWRLVIKQYFGDVPESLWSQPESAYSGAFLIGLLSVAIIGRVIDHGKDDESE